ncbi:protoporphyrinogen oxidase [Nocardia callitridis]|uniref:Protoporphyrinogen oxidase n=1 Tax=Nocardia callitridis TaxID=648753 RepID=A0ABP9KE50_9NOCA
MRIAIVGGGISGLVAAYRLRGAVGDAAEILVLDRADRVGGVLFTGEVGGGPLDLGAEAFVGRRPEVPRLMRELGLESQLVTPAGLRPLLWSQGRAHSVPERTLMGIPSNAESVRGLVDEAALAWIASEPDRPLRWDSGSDTDVYSLVSDRFGAQVTERSVDPLLGGVYAGSSRSIGVRAALPTLARALDDGARSLTEAVASVLPPPSSTPVFGAVRDGYGVLLDTLVQRSGATIVTATSGTRLARGQHGWVVDPVGTVDAVILATPAPVTARLLGGVAPSAASALSEIALSSSALVALALSRDTELPKNSGILVATGEPLRAKAFTLSGRKWTHLAERENLVVRVSFGKFGDDSTLSWSDDELSSAAAEDLATVTGVAIDPLSSVVARWRGGLAQYAPGHTERVAIAESEVATLDGLAIAGAYLHGVGVPACVASGTAAAEKVLTTLS